MLQDLPSSLTHLDMYECETSWPAAGTQQLAPSSWHLTNLLHFDVSQVGGFQTAAVARMQNLRFLKLSCMDDGWMMDELDVGELLEILPQLQQLQHLELTQLLYLSSEGQHIWDPADPVAAAASCAGFTASSQLTAPVLTDAGLPAGALQHMFPAGKQLPNLRRLAVFSEELGSLDGTRYASIRQDYTPAGIKALAQRDCLAVEPGVLAQLAECCPNLCELEMLWAAGSSSSSSVSELLQLLQLTALIRLAVAGGGWDDAAARAVLAHMTGGLIVAKFALCCRSIIYGTAIRNGLTVNADMPSGKFPDPAAAAALLLLLLHCCCCCCLQACVS
jgi:hypothetical protein